MIFVLALVVAVSAAARSTYSPCGLSMLSSITPFGERSRGHRYGLTAAWFVVGSAIGGVTLGVAGSALALGAAALGLARRPEVVALVGSLGALTTAGVDAGLFGEVIPFIRRQVDDRWMSTYRPWVYGSGFGWQVGVGFATYVMTSAVVLMVVLAALTGSTAIALTVCATFGAGRGLTVFLTSRAADPTSLRALHARLDRVGPSVRGGLIAVQVVVGGLMAARWSLPLGVGMVLAATALAVTVGAVAKALRRAT